MAFKLYNSVFSKHYLAIDPNGGANFTLRASSDTDTPLNFTTSNYSTYLRFTTTVPSNGSLCLDVFGDDKITVHLATCGDYSGQQWWWTGEKLSNMYTGSGWYMDVYSDTNQAFMSQGEYTGQHWSKISLDGTTGSANATGTSTTPAASSSPSSDGLSTGAKAGIGVGIGVGVLIATILAIFLITKRRRSKPAAAAWAETPIAEVPDNQMKQQTYGYTADKKEVPVSEMGIRDSQYMPMEMGRNSQYVTTAELPTPVPAAEVVAELDGGGGDVKHRS